MVCFHSHGAERLLFAGMQIDRLHGSRWTCDISGLFGCQLVSYDCFER
jgi:hypothetical protein